MAALPSTALLCCYRRHCFFVLPKKTSPDPILLYTDYILQRPVKLYCRIQDKYSWLLHLYSIFQHQTFGNME